METAFTFDSGVILFIITLICYGGVHINTLKVTRDNIDKLSVQIHENEKTHRGNIDKLSEQIGSSHEKLSNNIYSLSGTVSSLAISVATLRATQEHMRESQKNTK